MDGYWKEIFGSSRSIKVEIINDNAAIDGSSGRGKERRVPRRAHSWFSQRRFTDSRWDGDSFRRDSDSGLGRPLRRRNSGSEEELTSMAAAGRPTFTRGDSALRIPRRSADSSSSDSLSPRPNSTQNSIVTPPRSDSAAHSPSRTDTSPVAVLNTAAAAPAMTREDTSPNNGRRRRGRRPPGRAFSNLTGSKKSRSELREMEQTRSAVNQIREDFRRDPNRGVDRNNSRTFLGWNPVKLPQRKPSKEVEESEEQGERKSEGGDDGSPNTQRHAPQRTSSKRGGLLRRTSGNRRKKN